MKNNQKEIDMIVETLKNKSIHRVFSLWQMLCHYAIYIEYKRNKEIAEFADNMVEKVTISILTKLKENEIVLAKGKVKDIKKDCEFKIGNKVLALGIYPDWIGLELRKVENKTIELIARVVKDEN